MREELVKRAFSGCTVAALLGIEVTEVKEGFACGRLSIRREHLNVSGNLHGGVTFAFADHIGGACAHSFSEKAVLLESSVHYIRSTRGEKPIIAEAVLTHSGKKTGRVDTRVFEEDGMVIALVHQIFYIK